MIIIPASKLRNNPGTSERIGQHIVNKYWNKPASLMLSDELEAVGDLFMCKDSEVYRMVVERCAKWVEIDWNA